LDSVDIAAHLRNQIAQSPQFWGVHRRFPAKCAKYYQNYCTDHNQFLHSDKDPGTLCGWSKYAPNKPKMEDGRHLEQESLALASMARDDPPASSTAAAMGGKVGSEFET